jgi:hypothetical protein
MKRTLSLLIALLAYFGPPIWAYFAIEADAKAQMAGRGWVCGNPEIGIVILAGIASSLMSLVATGFGVAAFFGLSKPRPKLRIVELALILLPFLVAGSYVTLLFCA